MLLNLVLYVFNVYSMQQMLLNVVLYVFKVYSVLQMFLNNFSSVCVRSFLSAANVS